MTPQAFIFMGRYGSGKGTQADLLMKKLKEIDHERPILYMETGKDFRNFGEGTSYTAKLTKEVVDAGSLMPEFMPIYLWGRNLVDRYTGAEHLVFDGTPRKLLEAKLLKDVFPFYKLGKPWVIYLDVHHDESHKRLLIRAQSSGRADDHAAAIERRKAAYEADVVPSIEYYRTDPDVNFLDIDGVRSIEDIHADIVNKLGLA